jgi:hypothetical protein
LSAEKVLRNEPNTELKRIANLTIEGMEAEIKVEQSGV